MAERALIVGIDGGGTRTRCIAIGAAGHFLAAGESGPLMGLYAGQDAAESALAEALGRCVADSPQGAGPIESAGISVPICDRERLSAVVRQHAPDAVLHWIDGEALACLAAASEAQRGLVVLSGTGSFADAVDGDAVVGHAGGFGPLLGDDGSGYAIGVAALRAAVRASQGRGGATALVEAACEHFDVGDLWGLVERLYGGGLPRGRIAAFAPAVMRLAEDDDAVAAGIVRGAADDLADMARAAATQADWNAGSFPTVLCGGVLDASDMLRRKVMARLGEALPGARSIPSRFAPVVGAALLAMERRQATQPATIANLEATLLDAYKTGR
ncbi:MAG: BadF/BadG/BcrA/BcrD ATPase family protein [Armatimonadota bacterium]